MTFELAEPRLVTYKGILGTVEIDEFRAIPHYILTLDEDESALFDQGDDGGGEIAQIVLAEIAAHNITEPVFVYHSKGHFLAAVLRGL